MEENNIYTWRITQCLCCHSGNGATDDTKVRYSPVDVFGHHPPRFWGGHCCGGLSSPTVSAYGSSRTILVSKDLRQSAFFPFPLHYKDWTHLIFLHQPPALKEWLCRLRFGSHLGRTLKEVKALWIPYGCELGGGSVWEPKEIIYLVIVKNIFIS